MTQSLRMTQIFSMPVLRLRALRAAPLVLRLRGRAQGARVPPLRMTQLLRMTHLDIGGGFHGDGALVGGAGVVEPAARDVALTEIVDRNRLFADRHAVAAARRERASGRQTQQVGRLSRYRFEALTFARIQARQRRE